MDADATAIDRIQALSVAAAQERKFYVYPEEDKPVGVVSLIPEGWETQMVDFEPWLPNPRALHANAAMSEPASFGRYVGAHRTEATEVWVNLDGTTQATVIIDGNGPAGLAGWARHRASLTLRADPLFMALTDMHKTCEKGVSYNQTQFARLIERLGRIVLEPSHAQLRGLVDTLRATATSEVVSSGISDNGGRTIAYKQDTKVRAGRAGDIEFPNVITFLAAPWFGVPPVMVEMQVFVSVEEDERPKIDVLIPSLDDVRRDGVNVAISISSRAAMEISDDFVGDDSVQMVENLATFGVGIPLYYGDCRYGA